MDPPDRDGATPLMLAAQRGEVACLELLLEAGADPALEDNEGWTALDHAADHHKGWVENQRESQADPEAARLAAKALAKLTERRCAS